MNPSSFGLNRKFLSQFFETRSDIFVIEYLLFYTDCFYFNFKCLWVTESIRKKTSTVEVAELWTVFHEHYSLLDHQSSNMGCWNSFLNTYPKEFFKYIVFFSKLYSFYCVHNSTTLTVSCCTITLLFNVSTMAISLVLKDYVSE